MRIGNSLPPADFNVGDSDPLKKLQSDVDKLHYNFEKYEEDPSKKNTHNIRINANSISDDLVYLSASGNPLLQYEMILRDIGVGVGDLSADDISVLKQVAAYASGETL